MGAKFESGHTSVTYKHGVVFKEFRKSKTKNRRGTYKHGLPTKELRKLHRELVDLVKSHPCEDCGGEYPPWCMDLHHVSVNRWGRRCEKSGPVTKFLAGDPRLLAEELQKCVVLCAICHRLRHGPH